MTTTVGLTEARQKLHAIIERVHVRGESYIITRHGIPAAVLVPVNAYENWQWHQRKTFFVLVRGLQKEADLSPRRQAT